MRRRCDQSENGAITGPNSKEDEIHAGGKQPLATRVRKDLGQQGLVGEQLRGGHLEGFEELGKGGVCKGRGKS